MSGYDPRQAQRPATPPQWQGRQQPQWAQPGWQYDPAQPEQAPYPQAYYEPQRVPPPYNPNPALIGYMHARPPRRKRRVFLWVFLAIQALFLIWIITGVASHPAGPTAAAQAARQCANGGWQGLFTSQADCTRHYAVALNDAGNIGKGLGVAVIVIAWIVVDFFVGLGYGIYRLASRPR